MEEKSKPNPTAGTSFRERNIEMERPSPEDVCPICFAKFLVACQAPCAHWFCGGCILQYWNYGSAFRPCKCPMCFQHITRLKPEASVCHLHDVEVVDILKSVEKYNRLFVGNAYGRMMKLLLMIKTLVQFNLDDPVDNFPTFRIYAVILGIIYTQCSFDFLPTGWSVAGWHFSVMDRLEVFFIIVSIITYFVRRLLQPPVPMANHQL